MTIKLVCFSDTHGKHEEVIIPECDVAIFAGDMSGTGNKYEVEDFMEWFSKQHQATEKIFIAGNHDISFDPDKVGHVDWLQTFFQKYKNLHYLCDSGIELFGLKFWGSPVTPDFFPEYWAFNKPRGEEIMKVWKKIPDDTNILIVHGPARGLLDRVPKTGRSFEFIYPAGNVGCDDLRKRFYELKKLKLFVCGHIHDNTAVEWLRNNNEEYSGGPLYANVAILDNAYEASNDPTIITLEV